MGFVLVTGLSNHKAQKFLFSSSAVVGDIYISCLGALRAILSLTVLTSCPQGLLHGPRTPPQPLPGPSVPASVMSQQVWSPGPHSPALGSIKPGPPTGYVQPGPVPEEVADAQGWGCPPLLPSSLAGGVGQAQACHCQGSLQSPGSPRPLQCSDKLQRTMPRSKLVDKENKDKYYKAYLIYKPQTYIEIDIYTHTKKPKHISPILWLALQTNSTLKHVCASIFYYYFTC